MILLTQINLSRLVYEKGKAIFRREYYSVEKLLIKYLKFSKFWSLITAFVKLFGLKETSEPTSRASIKGQHLWLVSASDYKSFR